MRHICFFFFKQKTAYEMRISDWSSGVCSSDLIWPYAVAPAVAGALWGFIFLPGPGVLAYFLARIGVDWNYLLNGTQAMIVVVLARSRSEEHTSELQSLMRISYAVFCLKKKTKTPSTTNNP